MCILKLAEPEKPTGAPGHPDSLHQTDGREEIVQDGSKSSKDVRKSRSTFGPVRRKRLYLLVACVLIISLAIVAVIVGLLTRSTGTGSVSESAHLAELQCKIMITLFLF